MPDQTRLTSTLVELADTLVDDFDVIDLLTLLVDRCVDILEISAAGLMLATPARELRMAASSSEAMRLVELFEIQAQEGPCLDCYRSGRAVVNDDLATDDRWPVFSPVAVRAGFRSAHALPMRLRGNVVGALNLFGDSARALSVDDHHAGQALADMATISILQDRASIEAQLLNAQLNRALTSRIAIEQAKGVLAERAGITVEEAFDRLRRFARRRNVRLAEVARSVVEGHLLEVEP
ncbi:MAG: GAF and ANTAR domain-containing protein [Acidimicrobiales bacterium]